VSISADGTVVAIGANVNDGPTTNTSDGRGHVRIYKYNSGKSAAITDQSLPNFGPAGWDRIGVDIDGEAPGDQSGYSVSLSADGTTLAIGGRYNYGAGINAGHVRIYKLDTYGAITYTSSNPAVADIYGNALLLINDISDGVTTITATQAAVPPFTLAPITVQGTLTVSGKTTRTLVYNSIVSTYTPFSTSALTVAYGRNGSQGTGAPRWIVGGSGGNVFAMSSRPTATTTGAWSVVSTNDVAAPFSVCNSIAYSNGLWVAGNNTDATNVIARSTDGGATWTPVTASSVSGIIAGSTAIGANAFCNYSLAVADYSNDTNLRSWNAVQGTKNFMFDGGVNSVATVTPNVSAAAYNEMSPATYTIATAGSAMVPPPWALAPTYGADWVKLGDDILGNQTLEQRGYSVSLSADGTVVAIGSNLYDKAGGTTNAGTNEGLVRIYKYNGISWNRLGADISGNQTDERSGSSVSLSADGTVVAIGSFTFNVTGSNDGQTRIYKYDGISWNPFGPVISGNQVDENSGISVSLSADGNTVAIGSSGFNTPTPTADAGRTRIYKYNGTSWNPLGQDILGNQAYENSGYSVSLSADGTTVAIGSYDYDIGANANVGRTRIFRFNGTSWIPLGLDISGNQLNENSGWSVSLSADGNTVAIGSRYYDIANNANEGRVHIYKFNGISWDKRGVDISGNQVNEYSGWSVSLSADGTTVAIGSSGFNISGGGDEGRTRIYKYDGISWNPLGADILGNQLNEQSGISVSLSADGTTVAIGSPYLSPTAVNLGRVRIYKIPTTNAITYTSSSSSIADIYGNAILLIKSGANGTSTITATQGSTTTNGVITVSGTTYTLRYGRMPWWVAGGRNQTPSIASIAYSSNPSGATDWTLGTSTTANGGNGISDLAEIRDIKFSPHTQQWLAVGVGSPASPTRTALYSSNGIVWTSAVVSSTDASLQLNTCAWNQLDVSASAAGRWLVGGISGGGASSVSLFISSDVTGQNWTPIAGTGDILSQVYSLAYNGRVWIAAGSPATSNGSTSTLMRTTDPSGATGWQGIAATNISTSGFDTAARSVTWNADQQMWVATGENTGTVADASFSSVIYSLDVTGSAGTWRTVRESNSVCFSGEGTGIAFTGDKWLASGEGNNQIVATTGSAASAASTASWTPIAHGTALTRASDIAYTGSRLIATGAGTGSTNGVILSTDNSGGVWSAAPATPGPAFTDALGGATSITFEASYEGVGRAVATGRSATNSLSVSTDGGATWLAPSVQYATLDASSSATTQPLFTTGGNSVAYVGNDTLFSGGGNDVQWNGKRWIATGRNSSSSASSSAMSVTATASTAAPLPDIINNNTSAVATSDDGMTWQCVSSAQAPNLSEGTFLASNPRIGATPLINSQIVIADGGDTEASADYGGMVCDMGGSGTGVAQIDIIAELTPVSTAASSVVSGAVGILGTAGNAPSASFDNTAFTITTRPM
jgi:hypothetical protein